MTVFGIEFCSLRTVILFVKWYFDIIVSAMKSVIVLFLGYFIFWLERAVYCDRRNYQIVEIETISEDLKSHRGKFEIDERRQYEILPEKSRMNLCKKACKEVEEKKGFSVQIMKAEKPGIKKPYIFHTRNQTPNRVQVSDAFACPTKPRLYLQVHRNAGRYTDTITVLVVMSEVSSTNISPLRIIYELQLIQSIFDALPQEISSYDKLHQAADPKDYSRDYCLQICKDAFEALTDGKRKWSFGDQVGAIKFYKLFIKENELYMHVEIVQAFQCTSDPLTFVSVPTIVDEEVVSRVFVTETDLHALNVTSPEVARRRNFGTSRPQIRITYYEYQLRIFRHIADGLFHGRKQTTVIRSAIDTDELSEEQRLQMCMKALRVAEYECIFATFLQQGKTEPSDVYALLVNLRDHTTNIEHVEAFQCPTKPVLYIHVNKVYDTGGLIWVLVAVEPTIDDAVYNVQIVKTISEASLEETHQSHVSIENSQIDSDDLLEHERQKVCRKATEIISAETVVEYYEDDETGMDELHVMKPAKQKLQNQISFEKSRKQYEKPINLETNTQVVHAFACPTKPRIYLQIHLDSEIDGYSVRIFIQGRDLDDKPSFHIKYVNRISKYPKTASEPKGSRLVDTADFTEDERMQFCVGAIEHFRGREFEIEQDGRPDMFRNYLVHSPQRQEVVRAFTCPVIPVFHITVKRNTDDRNEAQILIKNVRSRRRTAGSDHFKNITYKVLFVDDIVDFETHGAKSYDIFELPPILSVDYMEDECAEMCARGLEHVPGHETIDRLRGCDPSDDTLYVIDYVSGSENREQLIMAYECPTEPSIYLQLYEEEETRRIGAQIIVKRLDLPDSARVPRYFS